MKKSILFLALTLCAGLWAQESSQPDTVRIFNDILIVDEVYNPKTWEQVGWSYNSHNDEELYTFIRTNTTDKFGTFSFENHTIDTVGNYNIVEFITRKDTVNVTFIEGKMIVSERGDSIILDGEFKGDDGKVYLFHCTHLTAALNADTDMDMEQEYEYYQMFSYVENGLATIEIDNKETTVTLELYINPQATDIPEGTYQLSTTHEAGTAHLSTGVERFDPQPCYAGTMDTLTGVIRDFFFMTEGSITIQYNEYGKMNVEINTKNSYNRSCHMTVTHHHVEPIDSIIIEEDAEFAMAVDPLRPQFYTCQIFEQARPFAIFLVRTRDISGDFSKEICLPSSMIQARDGFYRSIVDFEQCTVTKKEKDMTIETRFIANDSILYIIRATGYEDAIIGDSKNDYEGDFLIEDISLRQNKGDTCIFHAESSITGDHIKFAFLANFREDSTIIPDTYTGIIPGGDWVLDEGALPSYITNAVGAWYIQSGMMTVNEDGSMSFEGLNSYDRTVKFTVTAKGTALPSTSTFSSSLNKFLYNGQLYIRKNDKTYNAVGVEL
ncbi:MAG: hypothetical protein MJZ59_02320 [Paludibacteraceae bacterium]|nr:hypothetical protein [Paludibacteraceae bacterium]